METMPKCLSCAKRDYHKEYVKYYGAGEQVDDAQKVRRVKKSERAKTKRALQKKEQS